ncbi:MAG TPA: anti-sigma factor [Blastocatellia bacterium]|nr:anti-sigma factor [Blastocatellia bacterium]
MRHDRLTEEGQELAALYALGSLSQHEARAFESHLREGCEACKIETEQFERVVGAMGSEAPAVTPPVYLRSLLEARVEKESRLNLNAAPEPAAVIPFPEKSRSTGHAAELSRPAKARTLIPWAIAASLLIALTYAIASWQSERRTHQNEVAELRDDLNRASGRANELAQIDSVIQSPENIRIAMAGLEAAPSSSAKVYWDVRGRRWVVTADLPPAPAGKVYQLWFVTPDAKVSAGLIQPDDRGHAFSVVDVPPAIEKVDAAAITLEPQGGSAQPTMPIYVMGKVS